MKHIKYTIKQDFEGNPVNATFEFDFYSIYVDTDRVCLLCRDGCERRYKIEQFTKIEIEEK